MMWLLVLLAMTPASLIGQAAKTPPLPVIERHRVGPVVVGGDAQELYRQFPPQRRHLIDRGLEGTLSPALLLRFDGAALPDGVVAELECGKVLTVWRIEVRDPIFRTAKGIGVGSTVGQLRAAYRLDGIGAGEGNIIVRVEELSASFVLDQSGPSGAQLWKIRSPAAVPDAVRISFILLTR